MDTCDVLIIGAGPAGTTCARKLRQAGLDVLLLDKELFPRRKTCAGWITPVVLKALAIDGEEYRQERVLQDISGFRTALMGGPELVTDYGTTVSYGIRRSEFDHFLLQRSGVRQALSEPAAQMERKNGRWIVNSRIRTRLLVGAGGHYCPVARLLGAKLSREAVIAAQAAEFAMNPAQKRLCKVRADQPELFFCRDMKGYGWVFRKGSYLNIGLGRMDKCGFARHAKDFYEFLDKRGVLPSDFQIRFRGHAYLLYDREAGRACVGDGVLLIGDAAGLAHPQSGEGILPAIESALLAADTILAANEDYRRDNLEAYATALTNRFDASRKMYSSPTCSSISRFLGARLLSSSWFTRHIVLDRWFLGDGLRDS